jgi:hypothetical protein
LEEAAIRPADLARLMSGELGTPELGALGSLTYGCPDSGRAGVVNMVMILLSS